MKFLDSNLGSLLTTVVGKIILAVIVLIVGNTSRKAVATGLRLDWAKAGCAPRPLTDVLSGKTRTEAEWAAFELPSHEFLILVP